MRIVHVVHCLDARSGGPAEAAWNLAGTQARRGHQVLVIASDAQAREVWLPAQRFRRCMERRARRLGFNVAILRGHGRRGIFRRYRFIPAGNARIKRAIREACGGGAEIVHVHGLFSHLTGAACNACLSMGVPLVLRPAGGLNRRSLASGARLLKRLLLNIEVRRHLAGASAVHVTSEREGAEVGALCPSARCIVLPHGVHVPPEGPLPFHRELFLSVYPELRGRRILLYLSRFTEKKRPDLLIRAFRRSRMAKEGWALVIVGDGPGRSRLQTMAGETTIGHITLTGFLTGTLRRGAFSAADVFCLPSLDENFGLAVVEAMAYGLPVLTTPGVDSSAHLLAARGGLVVPCSAPGLAGGLNHLIRGEIAGMGRRNREYVQMHLTWRRMNDALDGIYRECLAHE